MVKIPNASYDNEIHSVNSPSTKIPKIFFSKEALISGEGRTENLGKMVKNKETYCYAK